MLSLAIDILHWIAGAVLALVGLGYDRVEDCGAPVRQQTVQEASFVSGDSMLHKAFGEFDWQYTVLEDGRVQVVVRPASIEAASGCQAPAIRMPEAPRAPVLRL